MKLVSFKPEFFKQNRRRLREVIKPDSPIAVTANGLLQRGADSPYPFVQDANFWYLSGINDPDIILVIDGQREFLIAPIREGSRVTFDGQVDIKYLVSVSGIEDVVNEASGWKRLDALLARKKKLATLAPAAMYIEQYGMYANPARARFMERVYKHVGDLELIDIRRELALLRMVKQEPELEAIRNAVEITLSTLKDVFKGPFEQYRFEYEIEADLSRGFRARGGLGHAFDPIVAGGKRACVMHNVSNSAKLQPSELVVIDVGASASGYAADITRTVAYGQPTKRQQAIYAAVLEAQKFAFDLLQPGVHLRGYETKVAKFIGAKLKELGVIDNLKSESIRRYYPHATSHFLGLNVHDVGDYQKALTPGVVLTVEPGIYIPEEGIGVRIEDDILITASGIEILSRGLPARPKLK